MVAELDWICIELFCSKNMPRTSSKKSKHRFYGNRFTAEGEDQHGSGPTEPGACSSAKKVEICDREASDNDRKKMVITIL